MDTIKLIAKQIDLLINFQKSAIDTRLYNSAIEKAGKPLTLAAAQSLTNAVKPGDIVIISSGWCLPPRLGIDWLPKGENDGPPGAIALADALTQGLGAKIVFLQENSMIPVYENGCLASSIRIFSLDDLKKMPRESNMLKRASVCGFPIDNEEAKKMAPIMIEDLEPAALIAIEKCGRNEKGVYHSGSGRDMSSTTSKIDLVFDEARSNGILTIASIDGGNEIGGGTILDTLHSPDYPKYNVVPRILSKCVCGCGGGGASVVPVDSLVTASSSNLGAVGISAVLSALIRKDASLLQDTNTFKRTLEACVKGGSLCGTRLIPSLTIHQRLIDDWDVHIHEIMRSIINYEFLPKLDWTILRT